jgi:hypothetical protein
MEVSEFIIKKNRKKYQVASSAFIYLHTVSAYMLVKPTAKTYTIGSSDFGTLQYFM